MSLSLYALLDSTQTSVIGFNNIDPTVFSKLATVKSQFYRLVNITAQPVINPLTQGVSQNGWTVSSVDVQPVWVTSALSQSQIDAATAQTNYNTVMALNIVAQCTNAIANWALFTPAQKDTVLLRLVQVIKALLQIQFGINN
jgi:hypothetical protein